MNLSIIYVCVSGVIFPECLFVNRSELYFFGGSLRLAPFGFRWLCNSKATARKNPGYWFRRRDARRKIQIPFYFRRSFLFNATIQWMFWLVKKAHGEINFDGLPFLHTRFYYCYLRSKGVRVAIYRFVAVISFGRVFSKRILNIVYDFEPGCWPGTTSTRYLFMGRNQMYFICICLFT